jgi:hypothetical protein
MASDVGYLNVLRYLMEHGDYDVNVPVNKVYVNTNEYIDNRFMYILFFVLRRMVGHLYGSLLNGATLKLYDI